MVEVDSVVWDIEVEFEVDDDVEVKVNGNVDRNMTNKNRNNGLYPTTIVVSRRRMTDLLLNVFYMAIMDLKEDGGGDDGCC